MKKILAFLFIFCVGFSFAQKTSTVQPKPRPKPKPKAQNTATLQTDPAGKEKEYMSIEEYDRKYNPVPETTQTDSAKTKIEASNLEIFTLVEEPAEFPGGITEMQKFIQKNLNWPKKDVSGTCYLKFIVYNTGEIFNVELLKGVPGCSECDQEAIRVVKAMPKWKPGKMSGKAVNVYYNLPIRFKA